MKDMLIVMTNLPDTATAKSLARSLIEQRLAACVNVMPGLHSIYRWQGSVEETNEVALCIKTMLYRYQEVESFIKSVHPHAVPEIIAIPVAGVLPDYLTWIEQETKSNVAI